MNGCNQGHERLSDRATERTTERTNEQNTKERRNNERKNERTRDSQPQSEHGWSTSGLQGRFQQNENRLPQKLKLKYSSLLNDS